MAEVAVVIGSYNRSAFLRLTLESVRREVVDLPHEIIVVDGGSTDGTLDWLIRQRDVITILQHNRGTWRGKPVARRSWGYFMNLGFKAAQARYLCMLSDDCLVVPGAIQNGLRQADRLRATGRKLGALAFYWRNWPEQDKYWVGRTYGGNIFVNHGLYVREAMEAVGFVDESTYQFYHADGDVCLRMAQAGYECMDAEDSYIEHYSHANLEVRQSNADVQRRDFQRYATKWSGLNRGERPEEREGWIYRDYEDPYRTAHRFSTVPDFKQQRARAVLGRSVGRVKRVIRRVLTRA